MDEAPVEERDRNRRKMVVVRSEKKQTKQNVLISLRCRRGDLNVDKATPGVRYSNLRFSGPEEVREGRGAAREGRRSGPRCRQSRP